VDEANDDYRLNNSTDAGLALRSSVLASAGQVQSLDCNAIQTAAGMLSGIALWLGTGF
jgi:hypothetical protein